MRATIERTLPETVEILANTTADDGQGGRTVGTWAASSTVAGLVLPVTSPGDSAEGGRQVDAEKRIIRLPHGTTVTSANRLRIGSLTYEVTSPLADQSNALFVDCQCKRLA